MTGEELDGTISASSLEVGGANGGDSEHTIAVSDVQDTKPERSSLDARTPLPRALRSLLDD